MPGGLKRQGRGWGVVAEVGAEGAAAQHITAATESLLVGPRPPSPPRNYTVHAHTVLTTV
eukprot:scaffold8686_cov57-Phaeocystis_antarctica.AAC.4